LPSERAIVELNNAPASIVCGVRKISESLDLDMKYGTSSQPFGTMNTFRLIGGGYEIRMFNPERPGKYDIRLYTTDNSVDPELGSKSFQEFKARVVSLPPNCNDEVASME
jgi:hypothetical protein